MNVGHEGDAKDGVSTSLPTRRSAGVSRREFVAAVAAIPFVARFGANGAPHEHLTHRAPRRSGAQEHVVVVGAGAFGGWTALALLRAGMRVTLVDAWGAGNSRASSGGETRVIRAVYGGVPIYSEMAVRAFALWREAERRWDRQVLFRTGALWMCAGDDSYVRRSIDPMRAVGLSVEEWSPSEVARRYPALGVRDVRTAFFEAEAGFITARAACELVRETVVREGRTYKQAYARTGRLSGARRTRPAP